MWVPTRFWERQAVDRTLVARRLSAALGEEIKSSQIERVSEEGFVMLTEGTSFFLAGGNAVYKGPIMGDTIEDFQHGYWIRNGKPWNLQAGEKIRPLPGMKKHPLE